MTINRLTIADFRNIQSAHLEPISSGFNILYGNNGSGKTSLLEAIYYLSLGRSFRSSLVNRIIRHSADKFSIFAQIITDSCQKIPVGIERHRDGETKLRLAGQNVSSTIDLTHFIPLLLINSLSYYHLLETPGFRRKYLDWGIFYSSPAFLGIWKQFERALRQRNAALRNQLPEKELTIWSHKLIEYAIQFHQLRREYIQQLIPLLKKKVEQLLSLHSLEINYEPGWNEQYTFPIALDRTLDRDKQLGYTQIGPHRADFKILMDRTPIKDILSRGQQKLFVCAMILAQGTLLKNVFNRDPIYLIDDLPSELDNMSRSRLLVLLSEQNAQVFVTSVERESLNNLPGPAKMFHVEHGEITETM